MWAQLVPHVGKHGTANKQLDVGDLVLVRVAGASGLRSPWTDPRRVERIVGPATVEVEGVGRIHVCRLKFFRKGGEM